MSPVVGPLECTADFGDTTDSSPRGSMMVTYPDLIVADHSRSAQGRVHFINAFPGQAVPRTDAARVTPVPLRVKAHNATSPALYLAVCRRSKWPKHWTNARSVAMLRMAQVHDRQDGHQVDQAPAAAAAGGGPALGRQGASARPVEERPMAQACPVPRALGTGQSGQPPPACGGRRCSGAQPRYNRV